MATFKAIVVEKTEAGQVVAIRDFDESQLMEGDVTVRVTHSSMNYKDGLALTGKSPVIRRFPMIPGIDLAGIVESSSHLEFSVGDGVLLNTSGLGETHLGGFAQKARVKGDWLLPIPVGLDAAQAMAIGTAGYTAALSVLALERHGLTPDRGAAVVSGATGGVGSVATALLAKAGWHVIASTGRPQESDYLHSLGAAEVIDRSELSAPPTRPLNKERWIAGIDSVGSHTLANILSMTRYGGAVAACGLAQGMELPGSVAPFILRGVTLIGIESVMASKTMRIRVWNRLASDLDAQKLASLTTTIGFDQVIETGNAILEGKVRGRIVVEIG